ncbi:hypothetical protein GCM10022222_23110 [Amycolatopsis ultiminotia]|uniref:34 kDa antigenic protein n=1 Tax=Amycolatopsis ultiminotia TaxID=543629 RepID=A0ABP6VQS2_9PSEU
MTFPSGGPGYPQQGGGQPPQGPPPSGGFPQPPPPAQASPTPALPENLPVLLSLGVAVLGLVQYFIGFSDEAGDVGQEIVFLLVGGLLSGLAVLPKAPKVLPFAALFSVLGALGALDTVIGEQTTPGIVVVILVLGFVQMLVSLAALLLEYGVLKPPAPKPVVPNVPQYQQAYGQPYQQLGQYQPPQQAPQQPPAPQPPQGPQATTYAPQQGQFFQQPPAEPGKPGTPPGGFGQQG